MSYDIKSEEVGQYLDKLITRKYKFRKDFCRDFLDMFGKTDEDTQPEESHFGKIVSGDIELPIYDLLPISEILGVSCEEILSAGKEKVPTSAHITNYDIACSDDYYMWKRLLSHGCTLCFDEFKKSVIDYAFEKKNILLFKYMIEEDIIWLIADKEKDIYYRKNDDFEVDYNLFKYGSKSQNSFWEFELKKEDRLRTKIIFLAIESGNSEVLDMLRARDSAEFEYIVSMPGYNTSYVAIVNEGFAKLVSDAVAESESNSVLDYFSSEYEMKNNSYTVVCPFYSQIIETLIQKERYDRAEIYLKRAIDHNKKIYELIQKNLDEEYKIKIADIETQKKEEMMRCYSIGMSFEKHGRHFPTEEETMDRIMTLFEYDKAHNIVFYRKPDSCEWIISNLVCINDLENTGCLTDLIKELNDWFDKFIFMDKRKHEGLIRLHSR